MSFPKYPAYKNSNIKWCGDIPQHWKIARGKSIFHLQRRQPEDNSEIITAFRDGQVTKRKNRREDGFTNSVKEIGYQGVCENDLVIHAMDAFAGAIGVSDANGKCSPVYSCCTPLEGISQFYYEKLLRYMAMSGYISSLSKGVRERSTEFRWNDFSTQLYPLPPLPEQQAIARFLDHECGKIDALIAEQERLIALLAEKRQAVISHAVTKGLNPNAPMKDSGIPWIGMVPEGWELLSLRHCSIRIQTGTTPAEVSSRMDFDQGFLWYTPGDFGDTIDLGMSARTIPSDRIFDMGTRVFPAESVLVVGIGATLGKVGFTSMPCSANQQINAIIPNKKVLGRFLAYSLYVKSDVMKYFSNSSTIGIMNQEKTKEITIAIPLMSEQKEIIKILDKTMIDHISMINDASSAITLLKERRAALISAAVTGKIDVRAQSKAITA